MGVIVAALCFETLRRTDYDRVSRFSDIERYIGLDYWAGLNQTLVLASFLFMKPNAYVGTQLLQARWCVDRGCCFRRLAFPSASNNILDNNRAPI